MSGEKFKKWKCFLCGDIVVEGQRFVWLPEKGFAHIECVHEKLAEEFNGRVPVDVGAILDFDEAVAYAIVRAKQAEAILPVDLRGQVEAARHKLEGISALLGKLLRERLEAHGVSLEG